MTELGHVRTGREKPSSPPHTRGVLGGSNDYKGVETSMAGGCRHGGQPPWCHTTCVEASPSKLGHVLARR